MINPRNAITLSPENFGLQKDLLFFFISNFLNIDLRSLPYQSTIINSIFGKEARAGIEPAIPVLQTSALPLCYLAIKLNE